MPPRRMSRCDMIDTINHAVDILTAKDEMEGTNYCAEVPQVALNGEQFLLDLDDAQLWGVCAEVMWATALEVKWLYCVTHTDPWGSMNYFIRAESAPERQKVCRILGLDCTPEGQAQLLEIHQVAEALIEDMDAQHEAIFRCPVCKHAILEDVGEEHLFQCERCQDTYWARSL